MKLGDRNISPLKFDPLSIIQDLVKLFLSHIFVRKKML